MSDVNPQEITIRGRLSYPNWTHEEALRFNAKSDFPKKPEDVRPSVNMLLGQAQSDKLVAHLKDVFLPWCAEQHKLGPKERSALKPGDVKKLDRILTEQDWDVDKVLGLLSPVPEKTLELAPEAVVSVKVQGFKATDFKKKAVVRDASVLRNQLEDIEIPERGLILDLADTTIDMYAGCVVGATINLFAFLASGQPGITANTPAIVFLADAPTFSSGGSGVDEDALFMDFEEDE